MEALTELRNRGVQDIPIAVVDGLKGFPEAIAAAFPQTMAQTCPRHGLSAYNFGRRLKTLGGLTPYEFICKCWTKQPERFRLDPIHQMPGLNT